MDIQSEKLHLITQLAALQDAQIIQKIKKLLQQPHHEQIAGYEPNGKVISQSELIARAAKSNQAIKEGNITSVEALEEESKSW